MLSGHRSLRLASRLSTRTMFAAGMITLSLAIVGCGRGEKSGGSATASNTNSGATSNAAATTDTSQGMDMSAGSNAGAMQMHETSDIEGMEVGSAGGTGGNMQLSTPSGGDAAGLNSAADPASAGNFGTAGSTGSAGTASDPTLNAGTDAAAGFGVSAPGNVGSGLPSTPATGGANSIAGVDTLPGQDPGTIAGNRQPNGGDAGAALGAPALGGIGGGAGNPQAGGLAAPGGIDGVGGLDSAGNGQGPAQVPAETSPLFPAYHVVLALNKGEVAGLAKYISATARGPLGNLRNGQVSEKELADFKEAFAKPSMPTSKSKSRETTITMPSGDFVITMRVKKERTSFVLTSLTFRKGKG